MVERATADRVRTLYRLAHPHRHRDHGHQEWFRRELSDRAGIDVAATTVHKWLHGRVPVGRLVAIDDVLHELETELADIMLDNLRELGRG